MERRYWIYCRRGIGNAQIPSVNELVDRSGFEPLTSAVQRRRSPN